MSAVKRHLQDLTEQLLDSVRATGSALLVERLPITAPAAHARTLRAVLELGTVWLCAPNSAELDSLDAQLDSWRPGPPPAHLAADWLDALEQAAADTLDALEQWLEPWGLCLDWADAGLIAQREEQQ